MIHHDFHSQEQIYNHINQQANKQYFDKHSLNFNNWLTMLTRYQGFTIISSLFLLVLVATLMGLGFWQLSRMHEKTEQLEALAKVTEQTPLLLSEVLQTPNPSAGTPVSVSGKIKSNEVWLLDNQFFENKLGYKVLVKVASFDGEVFLDFGWVKGSLDRSVLPEIALPERVDGLDAVVSYPSNNVFVDNQFVETFDKNGIQIHRIQAVETNETPFYLIATQTSKAFSRFYTPVVMPPEKHLAYAIQWFGIALAALVIGFFALKRK